MAPGRAPYLPPLSSTQTGTRGGREKCRLRWGPSTGPRISEMRTARDGFLNPPLTPSSRQVVFALGKPGRNSDRSIRSGWSWGGVTLFDWGDFAADNDRQDPRHSSVEETHLLR